MNDSAPTKKDRQTRTVTADAPDVSQDAIAQRAFELYRARNGQPGDPLSDWLRAERELTTPVTPAAPPRRRRSKKSN